MNGQWLPKPSSTYMLIAVRLIDSKTVMPTFGPTDGQKSEQDLLLSYWDEPHSTTGL
jgi:hypothetical protein